MVKECDCTRKVKRCMVIGVLVFTLVESYRPILKLLQYYLEHEEGDIHLVDRIGVRTISLKR